MGGARRGDRGARPARRLDPRAGLEPDLQAVVWVSRRDPKRAPLQNDAKAAKSGTTRAEPRDRRHVSGRLDVQAGHGARGDAGAPRLPFDTLPCTGTYTVHGETGAGQVFKNWDPNVNEPMSMSTALAASCDTYFYRVGYMFYGLPANLGPRMQDWASRFGVGQKTGIDIGPESAGLLPTPTWRRATFTKKADPCCWQIDRLWKPGDSIQLAIGQRRPARDAAPDGALLRDDRERRQARHPHVVNDIEEPGDNRSAPKVIQLNPVAPPQPSGVDPGALDVVRQGLYDATHAIRGRRRASSATTRSRSPARRERPRRSSRCRATTA